MLLRLLPIATPSQPAPPTILFTLPLPTHPYTSRSLPLPPNLLAHRSVCLQEEIECSNVLLGEKSSWIGGIIDDVTFSLPAQNITIHLIDGNTITLPLTSECTKQLRSVMHEVQLSFAPPTPPQPQPEPTTPRTSISSIASTSSAASSSSTSTFSNLGRTRSPSALLLSLISPLLPINHQPRNSLPSPPAQPAARIHRRQARSILVDTYRRHVLPALRDLLPSAYLPWAITSETTRSMEAFETLRAEINALLSNAGVDPALSTPMKRGRSSSSSSDATDSDSDSDTRSPVTPATSIFSSSPCSTPSRRPRTVSPQSFLLSIPPAHVVPIAHRNGYAAQLARLTRIASRMSAIKKLHGRYEREEGKRKWLEGLERGRSGDKALRRAFSNGQLAATTHVNAEPVKRSGLWRCWTAEDESREDEVKAIHPAMMSIDEVQSPSEEYKQLPPLPRRSSSPSIVIPSSARLPDHRLEDSDVFAAPRQIRPALTRANTTAHNEQNDLPPLVTSRSDESLTESDLWDDDDNRDLAPPPPIAMGGRWENVTTMIKPIKALVDWDQTLQSIHDVEVEVYHGISVVRA